MQVREHMSFWRWMARGLLARIAQIGSATVRCALRSGPATVWRLVTDFAETLWDDMLERMSSTLVAGLFLTVMAWLAMFMVGTTFAIICDIAGILTREQFHAAMVWIFNTVTVASVLMYACAVYITLLERFRNERERLIDTLKGDHND